VSAKCGQNLAPSQRNFSFKKELARHWWLTPIILATQKAEVRRIKVQSQPRQIVHETLSQKPFTK
jgi:hypothetical protein